MKDKIIHFVVGLLITTVFIFFVWFDKWTAIAFSDDGVVWSYFTLSVNHILFLVYVGCMLRWIKGEK
jgi:hypothetical protein